MLHYSPPEVQLSSGSAAQLRAYPHIPPQAGAGTLMPPPRQRIDREEVREEEIVIEERDPDEVRWAGGVQLAPSNVKVYNPAFDATPLDKVTGIITEKGILGRSDILRGLVTTQLPR